MRVVINSELTDSPALLVRHDLIYDLIFLTFYAVPSTSNALSERCFAKVKVTA